MNECKRCVPEKEYCMQKAMYVCPVKPVIENDSKKITTAKRK